MEHGQGLLLFPTAGTHERAQSVHGSSTLDQHQVCIATWLLPSTHPNNTNNP
jgi:hypothetical protein